ncbi:YheC/YheD family protein [Cohnella zeiphila]|uniref:YheC/YheD family protein n=1 Tax=Cohnella zeiphila TaxID=2761120 RepID=A0A7X0SRK9_9BACL|nr:YheC/YheD family protein [Cohnella zeiphila]
MAKYKSYSIGSKWTKTKWLLERQDLQEYIPETKLFDKTNLEEMLIMYPVVYFKPVRGWGGSNIVRILKTEEGYRTRSNAGQDDWPTPDSLYEELDRLAKTRPYLLQKGIDLARTKGMPFDLRVMVQKSSRGTWKSTAIFAKIGKPGKVATNYNQGGKLGFLKSTLSGAGYGPSRIGRTRSELERMGVEVGKCFDGHNKGFRELGLDIGLDPDGKPWILEVNTRPQFYPLKHFKDQTVYRRILSYAKQYGRTR